MILMIQVIMLIQELLDGTKYKEEELILPILIEKVPNNIFIFQFSDQLFILKLILPLNHTIIKYSLVLNKRGGRLLIFGNFSYSPDLIWTPRLSIFASFKFSTCEIFKYMLSVKGILTIFCVRQEYFRRKSTKFAKVQA